MALWKQRLTLGAAAMTVCGCGHRAQTPPAINGLTPGFAVARSVAPLFSPERAAQLEGSGRDHWQQPDKLVKTLQLKPGGTVADIGAGTGYLTRRLSQAVGPRGTVYAEEVQDDFVQQLRRRARFLPNVKVVAGTEADPRLPPVSMDCFVLLTTYHEVDHPVQFLQTLHRFARPGARLAIIDFDKTRPVKPGDPPVPPDHQVSEAAVRREADAADWRVVESHEFLSGQFFLVFREKG